MAESKVSRGWYWNGWNVVSVYQCDELGCVLGGQFHAESVSDDGAVLGEDEALVVVNWEEPGSVVEERQHLV